MRDGYGTARLYGFEHRAGDLYRAYAVVAGRKRASPAPDLPRERLDLARINRRRRKSFFARAGVRPDAQHVLVGPAQRGGREHAFAALDAQIIRSVRYFAARTHHDMAVCPQHAKDRYGRVRRAPPPVGMRVRGDFTDIEARQPPYLVE